MRCVLVSHTHWDREWYRTFQQFRARLIDVVDRILELCEADPDYHFLLDGQSITVEDYLAIRPERRADLERFVRGGQIAIGPWYVQPDSLLPSGEAHIRNLLEGRRVAESFGGASRVGYTPDSFGHPARFPQILGGFGLKAFVYWRGNGNEIDGLPSEYRWEAPDGTSILACHLGLGYFAAAQLEEDADVAAARLADVAQKLAAKASGDGVLLMNGVDHQTPDGNTREVAEALTKSSGFTVERGLLDDFVDAVRTDLPTYRGELIGGRIANLLPGVWSTHADLKLRNRACERALEGWAEPWSAIGARFGLADERPALRIAWRELLQNQAHDSICGCSQDRVHVQMGARYDAALELAQETTSRVLDRLAGSPAHRETPWSVELDLAVFNPSPYPRTDFVRFALDPTPAMKPHAWGVSMHPLIVENFEAPGYSADGGPARVAVSEENGRYRLFSDRPALDVEFIVNDVPAFGWKRVALRRATPVADTRDAGRDISTVDGVGVQVREDGSLDVRFGDTHFEALAAIEDTGDAGDTYDFDPVPGPDPELTSLEVSRKTHPNGVQWLDVTRRLRVPNGLAEDLSARSDDPGELVIEMQVRVLPGVERIDLKVVVDNGADDHRLRLLFPTGASVASFHAASTLGTQERKPGPVNAKGWVHEAPATFPHQGWVSAGGLTVAAPGLYEGEVLPNGTIAITLLRATGLLSRLKLGTRPIMAGPGLATSGAQCRGRTKFELSLYPGSEVRRARAAELGLLAVPAGAAPLFSPGTPLLELSPFSLQLSAFKPAEHTTGTVVRVTNPTGAPQDAELRLGFPFEHVAGIRLDEEPADFEFARKGDTVNFRIPGHALRSLLIV